MHNLSPSARHVRTRKVTSFNYVTLVNIRVKYKRCSNVIILRYHFRLNAKNIEFSTCLFSSGYDARTWNFDLFLQSAETNSSDSLTPSCLETVQVQFTRSAGTRLQSRFVWIDAFLTENPRANLATVNYHGTLRARIRWRVSISRRVWEGERKSSGLLIKRQRLTPKRLALVGDVERTTRFCKTGWEVNRMATAQSLSSNVRCYWSRHD